MIQQYHNNYNILAVHPNVTSVMLVTDNITVEGNNITITCEATGIPLPTIVWTFNGGVLMSGDNVNITAATIENGDMSAVTETLTIMNVLRNLTGMYTCSARNSVGNDTSGHIHITVQCKLVMMLLRYCVVH